VCGGAITACTLSSTTGFSDFVQRFEGSSFWSPCGGCQPLPTVPQSNLATLSVHRQRRTKIKPMHNNIKPMNNKIKHMHNKIKEMHTKIMSMHNKIKATQNNITQCTLAVHVEEYMHQDNNALQ
jgi:septal ring factor EnvC (AmiA/AmiB activator)